VDIAEARQLFVDYYDSWQFDSEIHWDKYRDTTDTGYRCRVVFVLKPVLWTLVGISVPFIAATLYTSGATSAAFQGKLAFWVVILVLVSLLTFLNRIPSSGRPEPTGCWAFWQRRNEENYSAFRSAVRDEANGDLMKFHQICIARLAELKARSSSAAAGEIGDS
jgi:hypothetical protein